MSLSLKQYDKVYNYFLLQLLKKGKVPSFEEVTSLAGDMLPDPTNPDTSIYKYKPQLPDSVFDHKRYNKSIDEINFDLEVLFETLKDIRLKNINKLLYYEYIYSINKYYLNKINKNLDSLLFTLSAADENFFASFDTFSDLTGTDLDLSTKSIVDTHEGVLSLPISLKGSYKLDLSHLYSVQSVNIEYNKDNFVLKSDLPESSFGNIFKDNISPWGVLLESKQNLPCTISFTFSLNKEEFINRITLIHFGEKKQKVKVSLSVDNVNKKTPVEYSDGVIIDDQSKIVSLDFTDILAEFVHIEITKDESDSLATQNNEEIYEYMFGLKNLSLFITGREKEATFYSKEIDFSKELDSIGKVAITATESLPENTNINWEIAVANSSTSSEFVPITPQNRTISTGLSKELIIQDITSLSKYFISNSIIPIIETYQNIQFYKIENIIAEPVFGTAKLYRGYKSWYRDQSDSITPITVKDNFISFSKNDIQYLYVTKTEVSKIEKTSSDKGVVVLLNIPLYDSSQSSLVPNKNINVDNDIAPNYAIYKAQLNLTTNNLSYSKTLTTTDGIYNIGISTVFYKNKKDIAVKGLVGQNEVLYTDGVDYIVELDDNSYPTGKIKTLPLGALATNPSIIVTYKIDTDLLRFITTIKGSQIEFNLNPATLPTSQIIIKYRYVPSNILKASVKAKAFYGTLGNEKIFNQGIDFVFDSEKGSIQRLSTGGIEPETDLYVDFKYNETINDIDQFYVWAYIPGIQDVIIKTKTKAGVTNAFESVLAPYTASGEGLFVNVPGVGLVDITTSIEWPPMKGWVQFIVKSIPPESLLGKPIIPLIHQVITLKDVNNNYIFIQDGNYFSELTAIREPLIQVSYQYLKTNVLKSDDKYFALKQQAINSPFHDIVTNFKPNTNNKLYSFSPIGTSNTTFNGVYKINEEWKIVYNSKNTSKNKYNKVKVKAILTRKETATDNVTPKVFDYIIKVGYNEI